jgi:hypothetical protein
MFTSSASADLSKSSGKSALSSAAAAILDGSAVYSSDREKREEEGEGEGGVVGGADVASGLTHVFSLSKPPPTSTPKKKTAAIIRPS